MRSPKVHGGDEQQGSFHTASPQFLALINQEVCTAWGASLLAKLVFKTYKQEKTMVYFLAGEIPSKKTCRKGSVRLY